MTKKLLFLFDTDPAPSVFDTVVGYDGGAGRLYLVIESPLCKYA